jgi:dipicolinate synthase subunit A
MKIAVFGGDKRMLFAAKAFADRGHEVLLTGFDSLMSLCEIRVCTVQQAADECDIAVLPVRPVADGNLFAPFSQHPISINGLADQIGKKPIFSGSAPMLKPYISGEILDYSANEMFTLRNAELTAEGAVELILREYEGAVCGSRILVTGYGRIGKVLSRYLSMMGAKVTVAARNPDDRDMIAYRGMTAADYPALDWSRYQVIVNTVPAEVIDREAIAQMREDVFIIDLASLPGGVDFSAAKDRELTCIHALSLPGKTAPLTAGIIIKDTIMNILNREEILG